MSKKENPYVTRPFCDERFLRVMEKLEVIDDKVDKISEKGKDWRVLAFSILGSVISGAVVGYIVSFV